jgi:pilus assembly protein CpaB
MISRQSLIALGAALVLGVLAVYLANIFLTNTEQRAARATAGTTKVAVAAVPLDYGVALSAEKVRFVDYPSNSLPAGTYARIGELLPAGQNRVALRPIQVNEPILASKISGKGQPKSIASLLTDGMRAMAVRINDVSGVAGFIQTNDAVDVLVTRSLGDNREVTDVLLQNIKVLAIDQNAKKADGSADVARTTTLEVGPLEAQKLALAQRVGTLSLVLRKPGEAQNNPVVETVSLEDLRYTIYGGARYAGANPAGAVIPRSQVTVAPAAPPRRVVRRASAPARPKPVSNSVEIVRGTVGRDYEVGGNGS